MECFGLTPDYFDDRMLYRDLLIFCDEIDRRVKAANQQQRGNRGR